MSKLRIFTAFAISHYLLISPAIASSWKDVYFKSLTTPLPSGVSNLTGEVDFDSIEKLGDSIRYSFRENRGYLQVVTVDCRKKLRTSQLGDFSSDEALAVADESLRAIELKAVCDFASEKFGVDYRPVLAPAVVLAAPASPPEVDPTLACLNKLGVDNRVRILASKLPFNSLAGQSLEILSNSTKATPKEKTALAFLSSETEICFSLGDEWRERNYPTEINSILLEYRLQSISELSELYTGKITYGEIAKLRMKSAIEFKKKFAAATNLANERKDAEAKQREIDMAQRNEAETRARLQRIEAENLAQLQRGALAQQSDSITKQERLLRELAQA